MTYYIINWDTGLSIGEYESLPKAKTECRKLGHNGDNNNLFTSYPPIAFVGIKNLDEDTKKYSPFLLVYNPRFKKEVQS